MTSERFDARWHAMYPKATWLPWLFRAIHPDRWFRIHSLPNSKRYASTSVEWSILLTRQNTLFTDLLNPDAEVVLVSGAYHFEGAALSNTDLVSEALSALSFLPTKQRIDLHEISPADYEPGIFYQAKFSEQIWQPHKFDGLLREIAEDQTRAFFISWRNACIVAPYDGGVDVLLKESYPRLLPRKVSQLALHAPRWIIDIGFTQMHFPRGCATIYTFSTCKTPRGMTIGE